MEYCNNVYTNIKCDLTQINLIMKYVEDNKKENNIIAETHILQCYIFVDINNPNNISGMSQQNKLHLYRIFDSFIVDCINIE